jgi:hydrogenase maturation protease
MILLIAYGNSFRRDDGAGLVLAERLEQAWLALGVAVERLAVHQLTPELALKIAAERVTTVVFVDSRAVDAYEPKPPLHFGPVKVNSLSASLGHYLEPATLLTYAHILFGKQPPAWIVTAPGVDFAHGEGLSDLAQQALPHASSIATELLNSIRSKAKELA